MKVKNILENNEKWVSSKLDVDEHYFNKLSKDQKPEILYIGCSDSRVGVENLMGTKPGEVFVHRNIANMVVSIDLNVMSVLNYAVDQLEVKHIVVCGHYDCGGIKSAMMQEDFGILNPWLRNIRDVYRIHEEELESIENKFDRNKRLVELNVEEQCFNLIKTAAVQKAYNERGIEVHGWVFDIFSGKLIDLNIDFKAKLDSIKKIYSL